MSVDQVSRQGIEIIQIYWERFLELCSAHQPLPLIAAMALLMLIPLFFRWGTLDPVLDEKIWKELPLAEKIVCNHNTRRFR